MIINSKYFYFIHTELQLTVKMMCEEINKKLLLFTKKKWYIQENESTKWK